MGVVIKLRPPRPCDTANITHKFDVMFSQKFEKVGKGVASVADGEDNRFL
jgi:hypothetical protein